VRGGKGFWEGYALDLPGTHVELVFREITRAWELIERETEDGGDLDLG